MLGLFVHDHRFPQVNKEYYYSYGFDEEFFKRYLSTFDNLSIIGRDTVLKLREQDKVEKVNSGVNFLTIRDLKELKQKATRTKIDEMIKKSDYVIIRLPSILGLYAVRSAKKQGKPYLIEVVGCAWDAFRYQNKSKKIIAPIITSLCKIAIRNAGYVLFVTEDFLQRRYPTSGKSISCSDVTLHSVDESKLTKRLEKISKMELNKKVIIGTCSTVDALYKGQQYVIKSIAKLKSKGCKIEYQLVGGGDPSYLKSIAKKFGVEDDVRFLGKLKHEDVFDWLDKIDIYVQPSKTEGLPRSVIEAMSRGCPVCGSDVGGIPELIGSEFIFKKGDIMGICEIYEKFTLETMKDQAIKNHKKSKKYIKSVLNQRRTNFFGLFTQEANDAKVEEQRT